MEEGRVCAWLLVPGIRRRDGRPGSIGKEQRLERGRWRGYPITLILWQSVVGHPIQPL